MIVKIFTSFIAVFTYIFLTYNLGIIEFKKKNFINNLFIVYLSICITCLNFEMLVIPLFFGVMMILLFLQNKKVIRNFISYILKKFKFNLKKINLTDKFFILIILNIGLTALIFYINATIFKFGNVDNLTIFVDSGLFLAYFISTIIMTYIIAMGFKKEMELKRIEFENLQEYTSNLESMYNDMRKFRHDYINILSSLAGYIDNKDLNGLAEFFNKKILHLSDNISKKNYRLDKLQNIKVIELKGLLSSKVIEAQELGIDVFIDITEPVEFINMDAVDLCRAVGIILDNSIEAALLSKFPSLKICIINNKSSIVILIINSCLEENPPIYKMFQKGFSTKGNNRGLGLSNLKEILNNYHHISLDTSIENNEFIHILHILK